MEPELNQHDLRALRGMAKLANIDEMLRARRRLLLICMLPLWGMLPYDFLLTYSGAGFKSIPAWLGILIHFGIGCAVLWKVWRTTKKIRLIPVIITHYIEVQFPDSLNLQEHHFEQLEAATELAMKL